MLVGMDASFGWIRIALFGSQIQINCICRTPEHTTDQNPLRRFQHSHSDGIGILRRSCSSSCSLIDLRASSSAKQSKKELTVTPLAKKRNANFDHGILPTLFDLQLGRFLVSFSPGARGFARCASLPLLA